MLRPSSRRIVTGVAVAVGIYLVWMAGAFIFQRALIYPGQSYPPPAPPEDRPGREVWWLETSGGRVEAWYLPAQVDSAPALVFTHGNGELVDDWSGPMRVFARRGVAVLLVEYPGYGRSEGSPSQKSITEAMLAGYDRLAARPEVDGDRIVPMGRSLGGGAACILARERPVPALVLQSTFTSVRPFALRFLLPPPLVRDSFDNLSVVRDFDGPVLVVHGRDDDVVPYSHGVELAEASSSAELVTYDCAHNDCPPDWEAYVDRVMEFLAEAGVVSSGEAGDRGGADE